jgi:hypothetical protein
MTTDYHDNDISLNDALSLLLGYDLRIMRTSGLDILDSNYEDYCADIDDLEQARKSRDLVALEHFTLEVEKSGHEFERAGKLYTKLIGEIAKIRLGKESLIVMIYDAPSMTDYSSVIISRQSLYDWAEDANIKVGSAAPPPTRKHTTPLLNLLDELIQEFWEGYDGGVPPKNEVIKTYISKKYGDWNGEGCTIPGASDPTIKAICTIMRPVELRAKR